MENSKSDRKNHISLEVTKGQIIRVNVTDEESGRNGSYWFKHTRHSLIRSGQRGIDNEVIGLVIEFGRMFQKQGLEYYVLGNNDFVHGFNSQLKDRARNTVVVVGEGAQIVTCYRGSKLTKHIRRKQSYLTAA